MPKAGDNSSLIPPTLNYAQELLDAVPTGILLTDDTGKINYTNAEGARLFGYEREELVNSNINSLFDERFRDRLQNLRSSYTKGAVKTESDIYGKRRDGSEFPLEMGLRTLNAADESLIITSIVDITSRKKLEGRFEQVIEASPYGKLLVDGRGTIQLINPSLLKLFGYTKEELIGKSMDILLPERYRDAHVKHRESYSQNPSLRAMGLGRDLTGLHKNGTEIPIEIGLNPVETNEGQLILAAVTDITERKRLELNLKQANAHLEEFTYVASHDLKSPLRGISDLVEWIIEDLDGNTPPSVANNIDRIKVRISRIEHLIDDLLVYARAGKRAKDSSLVDVSELIYGMIEMHPVPPNFKIETDIQIEKIQASKTPLETVLRNLFTNAMKHHDGKDPHITIIAEAYGSYCLFTISDNGPGIPEAAHERVFRLFQTLSATHTAGSGIGLALAKRMTESHGGRIQLITKDGERGACFCVWWPRFPRKDIDE